MSEQLNSQAPQAHEIETLSSTQPAEPPAEPPADWREVWRRERRPLIALALIGALTLFSYALARGPSESLFLSAYDAKALPGLWVEIGLAALLVVSLYNRALRRFELPQVFQGAYALTALALAALLWLPEPLFGSEGASLSVGGLIFPYGRSTLLRLWSDLYIVVLIETYWSLANLYIPLKAARYLYGALCAAGTLGSVAGNLAVSHAERLGTEALMSGVFPTLALMSALTVPLGRAYHQHRERVREREHSAGDLEREGNKHGSLWSGLKVVYQSEYMLWILWLVLISQVVVTLIDYQYKATLKELYSDTDARTAVQGLVYLSIDVGALLMQLLTGVTLSFIGVGGTLIGIPALLAALCFVPMLMPAFLALAAAKSASKFLTYSIFKSAKELLYFPLSYEEKTQGKAVIDILVYRQAKILASVMLLALGALGWGLVEVQWLTLTSLALWLWGAFKLWRASRAHQLDEP